jgi:uncharacterized protein YdeI (YjbR/CyaY-like superfamily)
LIPSIDHYLELGCGRCSHYEKPTCKVHTWQNELRFLRELVLASGLLEEVKWSQPCYTLNGKNVLMIAAFKGYCCLSFMKGILLHDPHKLLELPGADSFAGRMLKLKGDAHSAGLMNHPEPIIDLIQQAIEHERRGTPLPEKPARELEIPDELQAQFNTHPGLEKAFFGLTPGRQRAYMILINGAAQSATKTRRIQRYIPAIFVGKGPYDP